MLFLHVTLLPQQNRTPFVKTNGIYTSESIANSKATTSKDLVIPVEENTDIDLETLVAENFKALKRAKQAGKSQAKLDKVIDKESQEPCLDWTRAGLLQFAEANCGMKVLPRANKGQILAAIFEHQDGPSDDEPTGDDTETATSDSE